MLISKKCQAVPEDPIQKPSWIHDAHDETKVYDPATGKLVRLDVSQLTMGFHWILGIFLRSPLKNFRSLFQRSEKFTSSKLQMFFRIDFRVNSTRTIKNPSFWLPTSLPVFGFVTKAILKTGTFFPLRVTHQ